MHRPPTTNDLLKLIAGTPGAIANEFLLRLEQALNNTKVTGLLITDKEASALLQYVLDLQAELSSLEYE